ncbi:hypothetical protein UPYG_G00072650 [Umbra pygmaea]|uniref:Uncharacterized protein n=1 Tax=Umbra pygmaea TaxID=75934 RepID=A0ABD0XBY1_UMBPY
METKIKRIILELQLINVKKQLLLVKLLKQQRRNERRRRRRWLLTTNLMAKFNMRGHKDEGICREHSLQHK